MEESLLGHFADEEMVVDLQDVFQRFMFDITFILITGSDPRSLSIEMPQVEFAKALEDIEEAIVYRHLTPRFLWKNSNGESEDLLTSHIKLDATKYELLDPEDDKFLRDIAVGFMVAQRDTTASALTWFFWILSENPNVLNKLVYLHGALNESLRLYPPIPFERKSPIKPDVLPSGHKVESNMNIMIFLYAMGRMKAVWGEDATDYKPERWISDTGELRHEPSYKFLSFNAGPRTCIGKNIAMDVMKTVVVEILQIYEINVVKGQKIEPKPGLILHMKQGFKVTIAKKCSSLE